MEESIEKENNSITIKGLESYLNNPFLDDLKASNNIEVRIKKSKDLRNLVDSETSEVFDVYINKDESQYFWKDSAKFIKIFNHKDNFREIADLSKHATYMFWYIMGIIRPNTDMIVLSHTEFSDFSKIKSKMAYYSGIVELANKKFIAKISNTTYFINYSRFINGNRTEFLGDPEVAYFNNKFKKDK